MVSSHKQQCDAIDELLQRVERILNEADSLLKSSDGRSETEKALVPTVGRSETEKAVVFAARYDGIVSFRTARTPSTEASRVAPAKRDRPRLHCAACRR